MKNKWFDGWIYFIKIGFIVGVCQIIKPIYKAVLIGEMQVLQAIVYSVLLVIAIIKFWNLPDKIKDKITGDVDDAEK